MRTLSRAIQVFVVTSLLVMAGIAFEVPRANAGPVVDPTVSEIEHQVQRKITMLPWFGVFDNLQYQVNGTEVILSGQVTSEHDQTKYDAGRAVKSIAGVTNVVNNIEVLPLSTFDNQTRRAEYRAIFSNSNLGRYSMGAIPQLHIIVKNGHVTLEGVVMNQMDRDIAGIVANAVPGVFSVTNHLQIG
jgi:hyperosmotically inducible periplasmic protein